MLSEEGGMLSEEGGMLSEECIWGLIVVWVFPCPFRLPPTLLTQKTSTFLTQIHSPLHTPHSTLNTPLHAARHTERSSDGSKDTDGNLQDSFPSVLVHDFLDLIVSNLFEFRI